MTEDIDRHIESRGGDRELLEADLRTAMVVNAAAADELVALREKLVLAEHACRLAIVAFGDVAIGHPMSDRQMRQLEAMLHLQAVAGDES